MQAIIKTTIPENDNHLIINEGESVNFYAKAWVNPICNQATNLIKLYNQNPKALHK